MVVIIPSTTTTTIITDEDRIPGTIIMTTFYLG
jgi:hypothetical protein